MGKIKSTEVYAKWNGEKQDGCITVTQDGVTARFGLGLDRYDSVVIEHFKNSIKTLPSYADELALSEHFIKKVHETDRTHSNN